jgi:hypothetical protein
MSPGTPPASATPAPDKATVRVRVCNYISTNCSDPVRGVTASVCDKRDVKCENPRIANLTDVDGMLQFDVPTGGALGTGFDGYLLVKSGKASCVTAPEFGRRPEACLLAQGGGCDITMPDSEACKAFTYIGGALFFNPAITHDVTEPLVMPLFPALKAVDFVMAAGALATDPTLGVVYARAVDCDGKPAPNLTFGVSAGPAPLAILYESEGVISTGAKETDASGSAGLLGIPAGFVTLSAYADSATQPREVASIGTQILASTVTYVTLAPSRPAM